MPQRKRPTRETPKVEDESTDTPGERQDKQREQDEGVGAKGSTRGGMYRAGGEGTQGRQQNRSTLGRLQNRSTVRPDREATEFRRSRKERDEPGGGAGIGDDDLAGSGEYPEQEEDRA